MKTIIATLLVLLHGAAGVNAQATVGSLTYNTVVSAGKFVPIYGIDPIQPTQIVHGNDESRYAGREAVRGVGFWAELWAGTAADESALSPVANTLVHFKASASAIDSSRKVDVAGTHGGDTIFIQLRVWDTSAASWAEAVKDLNVARGVSAISSIRLGGADENGNLYLPLSTGVLLEGFGLYLIPEPSVFAFGGLGIGALVLWRPRSSPRSLS